MKRTDEFLGYLFGGMGLGCAVVAVTGDFSWWWVYGALALPMTGLTLHALGDSHGE